MSSERGKQVEYLHKNSRYVFPAESKIFLSGNKLVVEIHDKRTTRISNYIKASINHKWPYKYKIGLPVTGNGTQLVKEYQVISDFLHKHQTFDFFYFDYITSHELALCTFFKSTDLAQEENIIHDINKEMPYLLNIFKRPLIHLKESSVVQPVDMAKRINHKTIVHLTIHPENVESIKRNHVKPSKLLTRVYIDDYGIYENIVFRDLIDKILSFLRKRIYCLVEILDTFKESVNLDDISRFNHSRYFLAIGKLYLGFAKMENYSEISNLLEESKRLHRQINKHKIREVYTKNAAIKPIIGEIKKTNILMLHKDYKHVYKLYQKFSRKAFDMQDGDYLTQVKSQKSYEQFCMLLALFAVSGFNMMCEPGEVICENQKANASFWYKDWKTTIVTEYIDNLDINGVVIKTTHMDKKLKFLLIPMGYHVNQGKKKQYEHIIERLYYTGHQYDKYVFLEPFFLEDKGLNDYSMKYQSGSIPLYYAVLPVSISEINSFRRIQKLLFEMMVRSNQKYDICAFCGDKLVSEDKGKYACYKCKTVVRNVTCLGCDQDFVCTYVEIISKKMKSPKDEDYLSELSNFYKQEKQYLFRNIVNMKKNNFLCPHCGKENINK